MEKKSYFTPLWKRGKRFFRVLLMLCMMVTFAPVLKTEADAAFTPTGDQAADIVAYAKTQVGIKQSGACAYFITSCASKAGLTEGQMKLSARMASPYSDEDTQFGYINHKTGAFKYGCEAFTWKDFLEGRYQPKAGDLVFFGKLDGKTGTAEVTIQNIVDNYQGKWSHKHVGMLIDNKSTTSALYTINGGWDKNKDYKSVGTYTFKPDSSTGKVTSGLGGTYWVMEFVRPYYLKTNMSSDAVAATMSYNGHDYERFDYNLSWSEAKAFCAARGGHLVTITDAAEQAKVVELLDGCPMGWYHIGCTDPGQSGTWSWINGEAFTYSNWDLQAPEPNRGAGEYYAAIIGRTWNPNKQIGEWVDMADGGGTGFYSLANCGFICEYEDSEAPVISNVAVSNLTSEGYTVTCDVSDNVGVTKVLFPTWSVQNGQDDLPSSWPEGELSNGKASFRVNVSDHNGEIDCYYYTHIYAYDAVGNYSSKGNEQYEDLYVFVPPVDTEAPVISNVIISDISSTGYTVTCDVSDNVGVTKVAFPTWSEQNGQDDIASIWPEGELSNGKASFHVNVSDHNGENNCYYYTHIYAYDAAGNYSSDGVHFFVPPADVEQPAITDVAVTDVSSAGYLVTCNVSDNVGVTKVQFPTWTDADGQDDIIWHDATISNGIASCYIKTQDHQHQFGLYITHLYAWDADGNATCGGVGVDVPNPVSNVRVENITTSEFTVKCNIDPNWGAITIGLATWTMENNQDDMIWHHGAVADGVVTDTINIIDHNNENNCIYHTHIYAWDADDNGYFVGGIDTFVPKEIYPVTYNGNASDVSNVPAPQEKYYGVDLALSNTVPVRDGYDFLGWAASPDATAAEYQPGDYYSADANLTLYAVWVSIRNLPVAFLDYGGGGEGSITLSGWAFDRDDIDVSIPIHVYIGGPSAGPEVFVYKIIADKPRPDVDAVYGVGLYHGFIETIPVKQRGTQQVFVYAIDAAGEWQDNPLIANIPVTIFAPEYEVIYIMPNGSTALDSQIKNEGVDLILSTEEPTYAGHHFLGWSTNPDATTAQYQPGDTYTEDADLILYAVWEQILPDFVLPASLTTIEEEAFYGGAFTYAQVPAQVTHIGSNAFADCSKLRNIDILGMNTTIDQNAFSGVDQNALTIHGLAGSSAESFATEYGFHFAVID